MIVKTKDELKVFNSYHPHLLSFPLKVIVSEEDLSASNKTIDTFLAGKTACELLKAGSLYYVEYMPDNMAHLVPTIPDSNWEIKQWKARNGESDGN